MRKLKRIIFHLLLSSKCAKKWNGHLCQFLKITKHQTPKHMLWQDLDAAHPCRAYHRFSAIFCVRTTLCLILCHMKSAVKVLSFISHAEFMSHQTISLRESNYYSRASRSQGTCLSPFRLALQKFPIESESSVHINSTALLPRSLRENCGIKFMNGECAWICKIVDEPWHLQSARSLTHARTHTHALASLSR